uniref:G-protein coupled receptors family 1 profile domain-containing protein n=1 Tax=Poecilia formosa TaxID=48698 RepID=A0A087Y020_POEFO
MEELNFNNTSWTRSFSFKNMSFNFSDINSYGDIGDIMFLKYVNWITIGIGLPLNLIVTTAVFYQVKKGQDAPVYVINLLVSDLIQFCSRIALDPLNPSRSSGIFLLIACYCGVVRVGFMMCISCERYLVVAMPLWYRFRRNIKTYVVVCIVVWILPFLLPLIVILTHYYTVGFICFILFLFLPVPLLIFFLVGTIKALSGSLSVPTDEKRRITAIQVVVLIVYTLLYLPIIISILYE